MNTEESHPIVICITCGTVLHKFTEGDESSYIHPLHHEFDHEPMPVRVNENHPAMQCDFCGGERASWVLPVRSFAVDDLTYRLGESHVDTGSAGNWAACNDCAELIRIDRWHRVEQRLQATLVRAHGPDAWTAPVAQQMRKLWREVRRNTSGPLRPIGAPSR